MLPYKYNYLVGAVLCFVLWLILYWHRRDLRKEMLYMSICVAIVGLFAEFFLWTVDWWHPYTITGTRIGIEDLILGFTNGGVAAVLYEEIFKKRLYRRKIYQPSHGIWIFALVSLIVTYSFFYFFQLTSFYATTIGFAIGGVIILWFRKDLVIDAILSGFLVSLVSLPFYWILFYLSPGIVGAIWYTNRLSGVYFAGIPVEDLVFYFFVGFTVGPLYEFWRGERLRRLK